jgi:RNA polymerase sigma-70 factor (ECF subfamily)
MEQALDFERLVEFYRPRIFRFALASLRDRDAAETIAQDCLLKAHTAYESFRGDCSMQTWLMRIAVNLIRDHSRSRRWQFWIQTRNEPLPAERISLASSPSRNASPETLALLKQEVASVWAAADLLPNRQRTVFLLRFVEDMDILEIAAVIGMKEGTVKKHLFRALRSVRGRMGGIMACLLLLAAAGWKAALRDTAPFETNRDSALFEYVQIDLSRPVPSGLEPLFPLVPPIEQSSRP